MNIRKKLMAVILTFAMAVSLMPAMTLSANAVSDVWDGIIDTAWYTSSATLFTIDTAAELAGLASIVNDGTDTFSGDTITLGADIDLSGVYPWTPIGSDSTTHVFAGTFDGGDHSITLQIDTTAVRTAGLFGYISVTGTVENLTVDGSVQDSYSSSGVKAGCIAGQNKGTISNCTANGSVTGTTSGTAWYTCLGGITGYNSGSIEGCTSTGDVTGITTTSSGSESDAYIGGIAGQSLSGIITDCHSTGNVTGTVEAATGNILCFVGGIVGDVLYGTGSTLISQCDSTGQISGSATAESGKACTYVGGLAGISLEHGATIEDSISNCTVSGTASSAGGADAYAYIGGFIGVLGHGSNISGCYSDCVVSGSATASDNGISYSYIGGFAGICDEYDVYHDPYSSSITSCFSTGTVESGVANNPTTQHSYVGGLVGSNNQNCSITDSYSTCSVKSELPDTGNSYSAVGGLVGLNYAGSSIENCYATGSVSGSGATVRTGGFVGINGSSATITDGYFDKQTTGQTTGVGENDNTNSGAVSVTGLATQEMTGTAAESSMSLDFASKWKTQENAAKNWYYPQLRSVSGFDSVALPVAITGFTDLNASVKMQNIKNNSESASVTLPSTVGAIMNALYSVSIPVNHWSSNMVFPAQVGTYTFTPSLDAYTILSDVTLPQITVQVSSSSSHHDSSGTSDSPDTGSGSKIIVNGESKTAGTSKTSTNTDGKTVTTVTVDTDKLNDVLNSKGTGTTVTIPITGSSDVAEGVLAGEMVKNMENKEASLVIQTDSASYTLPASEIDIDAVSKQLGTNVSLSDIAVVIEIAEPSEKTVRVVENAAAAGEYTIVVPAVDFRIFCTYNGATVDANHFKAYVERMIAIPEGVDPEKITTGVIVKPDGTTYHVPTQIVEINGKYYAKINSLTNSTYTVIWHPVEFSDVEKHWAKDAINDMGSRMIVNGDEDGNYNPNNNITRAEFAAIIVRALGLAPETGTSSFSDVKSTSWYCGYVQTAASYGIIEGYSTSTFGPKDRITREQAMAMIARTMKITRLEADLTDSEIDSLLRAYTDGMSASNYAKESIAACLKTGIASGTGKNMIAPRNYVTRAEVAVMVQRLLQKSELI